MANLNSNYIQKPFITLLLLVAPFNAGCKSTSNRSELRDVTETFESARNLEFRSRLRLLGSEVEFETTVLQDKKEQGSFTGRMPLEEYRCKLIASQESNEVRETVLRFIERDKNLDIRSRVPADKPGESHSPGRIYEVKAEDDAWDGETSPVSSAVAERVTYLTHTPFVRYTTPKGEIVVVPTCAAGKRLRDDFARQDDWKGNDVCCADEKSETKTSP